MYHHPFLIYLADFYPSSSFLPVLTFLLIHPRVYESSVLFSRVFPLLMYYVKQCSATFSATLRILVARIYGYESSLPLISLPLYLVPLTSWPFVVPLPCLLSSLF